MDPINKERIYIFLDPCHMEKLIRGRWATCRVFYDSADNKIEWRYIEALYEYSCRNDFRTHKLTKKHIQWKRNSMNVRLAVETFSESVASSIEYLMKIGVPEFQGAQSTVDWIRRMDTLFNIFNSRHCNSQNIFKKRMSAENKRVIYQFMKETIKFFKTLKTEIFFYKNAAEENGKEDKADSGKKEKKKRVLVKTEILPILDTVHKVGFRGFIIDMESLKLMFKEYVEEEKIISSIPTYNLLQDSIEMMFGRMRSFNGHNNNPNVLQFKGAYRRVQCNLRLDLSRESNCRMFDMHLPDNLFYSNIFFVSSKRATVVMDSSLYESQKNSIIESVNSPEIAEIPDIDSTQENESNDHLGNAFATHHILDGTSNYLNTYIASQIEQKILNCTNFYCNGCRFVFDQNEKTTSIDSNFMQWKPCVSTVQICIHAEKFFKLYEIGKAKPRYDFKVLYCLIFRSMNFDTLYTNSKFECSIEHKYQFIKCIVGQYMNRRANQIAKQITYDRQDDLIRQHCNHLVNFKGQ